MLITYRAINLNQFILRTPDGLISPHSFGEGRIKPAFFDNSNAVYKH